MRRPLSSLKYFTADVSPVWTSSCVAVLFRRDEINSNFKQLFFKPGEYLDQQNC